MPLRIAFFTALLLGGAASFLQAQDTNVQLELRRTSMRRGPSKHSVSFSPYRPFVGFVDVRYEHRTHETLSLTVDGSYQTNKYIPGRDLESVVGLTYYPATRYGVQKGWFLNGGLGGSYSATDETLPMMFLVSSSFGHKLILREQFFLQPQLGLDYFMKFSRLDPALEFLVGMRF